MSTTLRGLKAHRQREKEQAERREAAKRQREEGRIKWFKLADGEAKKVRFLQELDPDADNYSEKNGIGGVVIEHNGPGKDGWKNKAVCTSEDEGDCYACNVVRDRSLDWDERKSWKQKERLYVNVLVFDVPQLDEDGKETGEVADEVQLLAQGNGPKSLTPQLFEFAEEMNTITDRVFKISRTGSEWNNTSYVLTPLRELPADAPDATEFELIDIEDKALVKVPFAEQEAHYLRGQAPVERASEDAPRETATVGSGSTSLDEAW